jgi:hypothetical protein
VRRSDGARWRLSSQNIRTLALADDGAFMATVDWLADVPWWDLRTGDRRGPWADDPEKAGAGDIQIGPGGRYLVGATAAPCRYFSPSIRIITSDRLSPPPRARWRALVTSISLASRGGSVCTIAPSSLGVK